MATVAALPQRQPAGSRPATSARILDAAFARIRETGLARTTMEDVARAAGLVRQTLYRYFPSKDHLVTALVLREEDAFIDGVRAAFAADPTLGEALEDAILFCLRFARRHPLLDRLLETDPETLLPYLTTRAEPVIARGRAAFAAELLAKGARPDHVEEAADVAVRAVLSYAITPPDRPVQHVARDLARLLAVALTAEEAP